MSTRRFDELMGNCAGVDIQTVTVDDIKEQCRIHRESGMEISSEDEELAIAGLFEYQELKRPF